MGIDLLNQMAKTTTGKPKKKDDKPQFVDATLTADCAKIIEAKRMTAHWEAVQVTAEAQVRAKVLPGLKEACRRDREVRSSIRINEMLTLTSVCKYSAVPAQAKPALLETFGEVPFKLYFKDEMKIGLTPEAAADEAFLTALIGMVGDAEFVKRFTVTRTLSVTPAFHAAVLLDASVEAKAKPFLDDQTIKQSTPSFKV